MTRTTQVGWACAAAAALLAPAHVLSPLDGIPLNGPLEAVAIGVVFPLLMWFDVRVLTRPWTRVLVVALLCVKLMSWALPQHGLCAQFSSVQPLEGTISTIEIREPSAALRSWDVRADWRAATPRCTAIFDRAYASREQFPVWFFNLLSAMRPATEPVHVRVGGYMNVDSAGTLSMDLGEDWTAIATVDGVAATRAGTTLIAQVGEGVHRVEVEGSARGDRWRFAPLWNGTNAYASALLTSERSSAADRVLARPLSWATTALAAALIAVWGASTFGRIATPALIWSAVAGTALFVAGVTGRLERVAPLLLCAGIFLPLAARDRNVRTAFVLVGVPWLALFVARSLPRLGTVTMYSIGDDWHMYQAAAYSIVLNGDWIRGGSPTFYFQPFYRWIVGALHIVFGDPSVGEAYWDAACLLLAAYLCFALVKPAHGFRAALAAAVVTLTTFTLGPAWYLIGRGLSDITGAGWMSVAVLYLLRAKSGSVVHAFAAGVFAAAMFWTRPNHLLLAGFLLAAFVPLRTPATIGRLTTAFLRIDTRATAAYVSLIVLGVLLYATRTWWYAGHFSVVYGTSLGLLGTGLTPLTIFSPTVWGRIAESVAAQLSMNEPPAFDLRAIPLIAGVVAAMLAMVQTPFLKSLPAALVLLTLGTIAGSFVAHTHAYPGRMSVHVIPFAVATLVCAAVRVVRAVRPAHAVGLAVS